METKNLKKLSEEELNGIRSYLLDNCKSKTSSYKGKTAIEMGYNENDLKALELKFDYLFGTDNITIFCQKDNEAKGKGFTIEGLDKNMFEIFHRYYMETRHERTNRNTNILEMISKTNSKEVYIDPDFINDRECD